MSSININLNVNVKEARMILFALEENLKGWSEAFDHSACPAISAMRDGDTEAACERMREMTESFTQWCKQMELINEVRSAINKATSGNTGCCSKSGICDDCCGIPF
jgi:hypothetical protein